MQNWWALDLSLPTLTNPKLLNGIELSASILLLYMYVGLKTSIWYIIHCKLDKASVSVWGTEWWNTLYNMLPNKARCLSVCAVRKNWKFFLTVGVLNYEIPVWQLVALCQGMLVMFPDVCEYTDTCVCKLHHVTGVRSCHSLNMEHAYAPVHAHSHCHSHAGIRPHMRTYKHTELRVSSQSLPRLRMCVKQHFCYRF